MQISMNIIKNYNKWKFLWSDKIQLDESSPCEKKKCFRLKKKSFFFSQGSTFLSNRLLSYQIQTYHKTDMQI